MIEALYEIGKLQSVGNILDEFIDEIGEGYKHVFKIVFNISDTNNISFLKIDHEEYDSQKKLKYLYKGKKGNASDYTPTSKITEFKKTFQNKICRCLGNFMKTYDKSIKDKSFFNNLENAFQTNREKIENSLDTFIEEKGLFIINKKSGEKGIKDGGVITFTFMKNNELLYLGDLDAFTSTFLRQGKNMYKDYYSKYEKISKTQNSTCYICKQIREEIWGFVNTYNFYTADISGMVTGGCKQELAWKNYPVCPDCSEVLNRGKKYVELNLRDKFCGFNYLIIPEMSYSDNNMLALVLKRMKNYGSFSLSDSKSARIENTEERILRDLSQENNMVSFNFLFFNAGNNFYNILLYLQEVPPSRLGYLIESKDKIDNPTNRKYDIFKKIPTKKGDIIFDFSFTFIRDFFNNSKLEGKFDKYFLDILNNIFIGKSISFEFLLNRFMERIRRKFLKKEMYEVDVRRAYKIVLYIESIKLLDRRRKAMDEQNMPYQEFFMENPVFDDNTKKAVFLEGVLAQKLLNIQYHLNIQYQERKATPFRSRLNGLKIDEKIAQRLLPEMINKLEEYDKNYYRKLEQAIGQYMLKSSFSEYTVNELSYYFTLGMTLAEILIPKKFDKNDEEEAA